MSIYLRKNLEIASKIFFTQKGEKKRREREAVHNF